MTIVAVVQNEEQRQRFEAKLKRELGDLILAHLADPRMEDILLNPDSMLWVKRMGEGFLPVGEIPPAQAASAMNTIAAWKGSHVFPTFVLPAPDSRGTKAQVSLQGAPAALSLRKEFA